VHFGPHRVLGRQQTRDQVAEMTNTSTPKNPP
jgi:hypothetical protein